MLLKPLLKGLLLLVRFVAQSVEEVERCDHGSGKAESPAHHVIGSSYMELLAFNCLVGQG